ncbi:histidinol dehydrogenase [Marinomonas sp.]|nr:histidinol dehydrogenase [Marinomonas sp.]MDB4837646.1 histidinol dehydrogenase [Marinomonas sp.]
MEYLKAAISDSAVADQVERIQAVVKTMSSPIQDQGEEAVKAFALQFDNWQSDFVLADEKRDALIASAPQSVKNDIQFSLFHFTSAQLSKVVALCDERGVVLRWLGESMQKGDTSRYDSWKYREDMPERPKTEKVLSILLDMRIPLTFSFSEEDGVFVSKIIIEVVEECRL